MPPDAICREGRARADSVRSASHQGSARPPHEARSRGRRSMIPQTMRRNAAPRGFRFEPAKEAIALVREEDGGRPVEHQDAPLRERSMIRGSAGARGRAPRRGSGCELVCEAEVPERRARPTSPRVVDEAESPRLAASIRFCATESCGRERGADGRPRSPRVASAGPDKRSSRLSTSTRPP
jgi:hypothetical protein